MFIGEYPVDSVEREGERSALCVMHGRTQISAVGSSSVGNWWSLGCVQKEWLTLEMFWLDHEAGLGKPCLKFTSRNEAEFTI